MALTPPKYTGPTTPKYAGHHLGAKEPSVPGGAGSALDLLSQAYGTGRAKTQRKRRRNRRPGSSGDAQRTYGTQPVPSKIA